MADLAATNITVTNVDGATFGLSDLTIVGKQKRGMVKLVFGNGTLTYPTGGVPLPAKESFGFIRDINMTLYDADDATGIVWKYDKTNHKLRGYIQGVMVSTTGGVTTNDFPLDTANDALASSTSIDMDQASSGGGTYYLGKLKEMGSNPDASATKQAPPATTLFAEVFGW